MKKITKTMATMLAILAVTASMSVFAFADAPDTDFTLDDSSVSDASDVEGDTSGDAEDTEGTESDTSGDADGDATQAGDVNAPTEGDKNSPDTGVEGVAGVAGIAIVATGVVLLSSKKRG